jgi:hypothetical protein
MTFVELGSPGNTPEQISSAFQVQSQSQTTGQSAAATANDAELGPG